MNCVSTTDRMLFIVTLCELRSKLINHRVTDLKNVTVQDREISTPLSMNLHHL